MTIEEKLEMLYSQLRVFVIHIETIEQDILLNPGSDMAEKPLRSEVLAGFREKKAIIENMIATLNEEENL
jgi:hypothetical protein